MSSTTLTTVRQDRRRTLAGGPLAAVGAPDSVDAGGRSGHGPLWGAVALACGVALYFGLPEEPPIHAGPAALAVSVALLVLARRVPVLAASLALAVAAAAGFSAGQVRTLAVGTEMLQVPVWTTVEGRVTAIEDRPARPRITLQSVSLAPPPRLGPVPSGVRVSAYRLDPGLRPGDWVRIRARLSPPPPPAAPGSYDFQRDLYFRGIGAVGYAVGPPERVAGAPPGLLTRVADAVNEIRTTVSRQVREALGPVDGAIAAALLVGDRSAIDESTADTLRDAGLAHLLAISGLHMGLVAGTVFAVVRLGLAAWPGLAARRPIKKWAAGMALAAAAVYLLLAGAPVPTQRAFLMTGVVLVAVIAGREALSMRLVAVAAIGVLLLMPESLLGASFQLSFAAVAALIASYEATRAWRRRRGVRPERALWARPMLYLLGIAISSLIASAATAPVVAYHFLQVPLLGLLANLVAIPATAFVTMPAGVAALTLMPFGADGPALAAMQGGIEMTRWAASTVLDHGLGATRMAPPPLLGIGLLVAGCLWLVAGRRGWRRAGLAPVAAGFILWSVGEPPRLVVSADGALSAVRTDGGDWLTSRDRGATFVRDVWRRRWGTDGAASFRNKEAAATGGEVACDGLGCVVRAAGHVLAFPQSPEAAVEDCGRASVVVTPVRLRRACQGPAVVIDAAALGRHGAHALWLDGPSVRLATANRLRGSRPWVLALPLTD